MLNQLKSPPRELGIQQASVGEIRIGLTQRPFPPKLFSGILLSRNHLKAYFNTVMLMLDPRDVNGIDPEVGRPI